MFNIAIVLVCSILFTACTSKEEKALMEMHSKNITYHKFLQKTEKLQLYENFVTKIRLTATYLYTPAKNKMQKKDEIFIIGFYADGDEVLTQESFRLTLDGKYAKSIKPLKKDNTLLKDISFKSEWSQFYLVHFPYIRKQSFNLVLKTKRYAEGFLPFAKVAKYVLKKEVY